MYNPNAELKQRVEEWIAAQGGREASVCTADGRQRLFPNGAAYEHGVVAGMGVCMPAPADRGALATAVVRYHRERVTAATEEFDRLKKELWNLGGGDLNRLRDVKTEVRGRQQAMEQALALHGPHLPGYVPPGVAQAKAEADARRQAFRDELKALEI